MKHILLIFFLFFSMVSNAQYAYDVSTDKENGQMVYKGRITFDDLQKEKEFTWFKESIKGYKPDASAVQYLKANLPSYNIVIFMGTWCDDSQNLVPKLYSILQDIQYPLDHVTLYGVDRAKTAKNGEEKEYQVLKVPTIILYKNKTEVGRIVETVKNSLEGDLADWLKKPH